MRARFFFTFAALLLFCSPCFSQGGSPETTPPADPSSAISPTVGELLNELDSILTAIESEATNSSAESTRLAELLKQASEALTKASEALKNSEQARSELSSLYESLAKRYAECVRRSEYLTAWAWTSSSIAGVLAVVLVLVILL